MWALCLRIFGILEVLSNQTKTCEFLVAFSKDGEISVQSMSLNGQSAEFNTQQMWTVEEKQLNASLDLLYVRLQPTKALIEKVNPQNRTFCSSVTVPVKKAQIHRTTVKTTTAKSTRSKMARTNTRYPVRFATYKSHTRSQSNDDQHSYVDIINDKKALEEVRRSRTDEINASWTSTFLTFFGVEVLLMICFVGFGLTMFVVLQFRPRNRNADLLYTPYAP
ncbi:hypothetical protein QR680_001563 [Steinernema hermaphroditum]|uniref:Uncharacterized protein n=1 Tax=Steinernema hermaphroditum TaxID=289476 RepID=A0AA39GYY7_9BILA|nr:hypothetical protein QR680_001563 [Steinernema hermaphroditum]